MSPGIELSKRIQDKAVALANQAMRSEILPRLSLTHPQPRLWNPLTNDVSTPSDWGVKLRLPDPLAMEILHSNTLMAYVQEIVEYAFQEAALYFPDDFVTDILDFLIGTNGS